MPFLCYQTGLKDRFQKHNLSGSPCYLFSVLSLPRKCLFCLFSPPSRFSRGVSGSVRSGCGWETRSVRQSRGFGPRLCTDLCASNYQRVGVLSKSWACGSFCSSVSIVVYVLNGMQMWFIVHGMMQLGKIGLSKATWTWAQGRAAREQHVLAGEEGTIQRGSQWDGEQTWGSLFCATKMASFPVVWEQGANAIA